MLAAATLTGVHHTRCTSGCEVLGNSWKQEDFLRLGMICIRSDKMSSRRRGAITERWGKVFLFRLPFQIK